MLGQMTFQPGEYRTRNGTLAVVTRLATRTVGTKFHSFLEGNIAGNPVGWNLDGKHSYGNFVLPGHADYDLVSPEAP